MISLFVPGQPAPQGSKKYLGRGVMVESSKAVKPWREDIRWRLLALPAAVRADWPLHGPVRVEIEFVLRRPKATPKRTTPAAVKKPDIDKLQRAVLDAVGSAGAWGDDSQVVSVVASKRLAELGEMCGCGISIIAHDMEVAA